jgi:hypothetical protein
MGGVGVLGAGVSTFLICDSDDSSCITFNRVGVTGGGLGCLLGASTIDVGVGVSTSLSEATSSLLIGEGLEMAVGVLSYSILAES